MPSVTFRDYVAHGGNSVGDPEKAAVKWFELSELPDPPLRLVWGKDAVAIARQQIETLRKDVDAMESWSADLLL